VIVVLRCGGALLTGLAHSYSRVARA